MLSIATHMPAARARLYDFGPYRIDTMKRLLLREGRTVPLTSKAFDTLTLLVEHHGRLLEKAEMIKALWPDTYVEDINLTVHISALRKALGERPNEHLYIVTVPGRGYRFVAPVKEPGLPSGDQGERAAEARAENAEAYRLYIKGRYFWEKRQKSDLRRAIECFKQAIALDPHYALAYAGLADCYAILGEYLYLRPGEAFPLARAAALAALDIDGSLAEAHATLAEIRWFYDWKPDEADAEYRRAIKLTPTYTTARNYYAWFLMMNGRFDEALAEINLALQPAPHSLTIYMTRGVLFYQMGEYEKAVDLYREVLDMDPTCPHARYNLGQALAECDALEESIDVLENLRGSEPVAQTLALLGYAYGASGKKEAALNILSELHDMSRQRYISPVSFATVYAGLGEADEAFAHLGAACEERAAWLAFLKGSPVFKSLRPDPRFQDLLRLTGHAPAI